MPNRVIWGGLLVGFWVTIQWPCWERVESGCSKGALKRVSQKVCLLVGFWTPKSPFGTPISGFGGFGTLLGSTQEPSKRAIWGYLGGLHLRGLIRHLEPNPPAGLEPAKPANPGFAKSWGFLKTVKTAQIAPTRFRRSCPEK